MTKQDLLKLIMKEIDNIPPMPENIKKIKELIANPESSIIDIAQHVKKDPSLMADLLKVANSASYMTRTRAGTAERAISTIGLVQLETIILSLGAKRVLSEKYDVAEEIWEHSYKCAFYTQQLVKVIKLPDESENAFTAGLLHDIGKLVLISLKPDLVDKIMKLSEAKNISIHQIEKLALGLSHAEIGEKIAINWNFPTKLCNAIGKHHDPRLIKDDKALVYATYLGNILCKISESSPEILSSIDIKVLEFFEISNEEKLSGVINTLHEFYVSHAELHH